MATAHVQCVFVQVIIGEFDNLTQPGQVWLLFNPAWVGWVKYYPIKLLLVVNLTNGKLAK